MRLKFKYIASVVALFALTTSTAKPRLVVNVVVSGMRQTDLTRYEANFSQGGFRRLLSEGVEFSECYADYAPTTSVAGLATLATGASPATHGIFSSVRFDRTLNKKELLCYQPKPELKGVVTKDVEVERTLQPFIAPTLSEAVLNSSPRNRVVTIAHKPLSAMILAGRKGECFWLNKEGKWMSADCYMEELPSWVRNCNNDDMNRVYATDKWYGRYTRDRYRNTRATDITLYEKSGTKRSRSNRKLSSSWVADMVTMPSGNLAIFEFAKRAVESMLPLHVEDECKMINICLDVPRIVAEKYGSDSIEYEDMLYSLDASLEEFLTFLYAQLKSREDVVVVLTSDGGMSPTQSDNSDRMRFNARQFEVIINAFLSARYGQDAWVLGYADGSLYLNHDVIYKHKLSVEEVQNETATFALQYRGVATAVMATAMRSAQFLRGTTALLQNGYNPRRSGDVLLAFEVERIELDPKRVAMSGSVYNYDRHIPFIVCGGGVIPQKVASRVKNEQIAPTLAAFMGVERPQCADVEVLNIESKK